LAQSLRARYLFFVTPIGGRKPRRCLPSRHSGIDAGAVDDVVAAMLTLTERIHHGTQSSAVFDSMVELDLSVSQFRALILLSQAEVPLAIHELADELRLSLAAAGRCVDRLVDLDLVERQTDPQDRRVKRVGLSRNGHDVTGQLEAEQRQKLRSFTAGLDARTRRRLAEILTDILEQTQPSAPHTEDQHTPDQHAPDQHEQEQHV